MSRLKFEQGISRIVICSATGPTHAVDTVLLNNVNFAVMNIKYRIHLAEMSCS